MDLSMAFLRGYFAFIALFVFSCCIVFCVRRFLWRRRKRQGKRNLGFCPTYTSAGNALQALQVMAQPRVEYVLAEKFDDEADDDGAIVGTNASFDEDRGPVSTPEFLLLQKMFQGHIVVHTGAVLMGVPAFVTLIALASTYLPALRASRIDPMHALRYE